MVVAVHRFATPVIPTCTPFAHRLLVEKLLDTGGYSLQESNETGESAYILCS